MPALTRWYLKASLLYLVSALLLVVLQSAASLLNLKLPAGLTPLYFHLLLVGL